MTCVVWRARVHYVRTRAPPFAYLCIIKAVLNLLSEHQNSRFSAKNALCHSIFFCCAAQPWWAAQLLWASGPHHLPDLLLQVVSGSVPLTVTLTVSSPFVASLRPSSRSEMPYPMITCRLSQACHALTPARNSQGGGGPARRWWQLRTGTTKGPGRGTSRWQLAHACG
jgi:hypothetical protein